MAHGSETAKWVKEQINPCKLLKLEKWITHVLHPPASCSNGWHTHSANFVITVITSCITKLRCLRRILLLSFSRTSDHKPDFIWPGTSSCNLQHWQSVDVWRIFFIFHCSVLFSFSLDAQGESYHGTLPVTPQHQTTGVRAQYPLLPFQMSALGWGTEGSHTCVVSNNLLELLMGLKEPLCFLSQVYL